ncbi:MAG: PulJ/GspJ family protein [Planctomycetota bacterium]
MRTQAGRASAGLTLVELLVAMAVLVLLGTMLVVVMATAMNIWTSAERQRKVWARARTVFSYLGEDLDTALTRDPRRSQVSNCMFCWPDRNGRQVLMLARTFGTGSERGFAYRAGDGLDETDRIPKGKKPRPDDEDRDPRTGRADEETYNFRDDDGDGRIDEDLLPLAGAAQVVYMHHGRELKRALRSPAGDEYRSMFSDAQVLAEDVLYFGLLFTTPYTSSSFARQGPITVLWDHRVPRLPGTKYRGARGYGAERTWDSTRAVLPSFSFHVGAASRDDGEDDVFPEAVQVTLVVESHELRTVRTDLLELLPEAGGEIRVASTRGFPEGGREDSYLLIDDEWIHYKARSERGFTVTPRTKETPSGRGRRGTVAAVHAPGAQVRRGVTFIKTVYLPGYRNEEAVVSGKGK